MLESIGTVLAALREAPGTLARLIANVPEAALRTEPGPAQWGVVAVMAHLAEGELITSWRYRQMLEHPGILLTAYDQEEWARRGAYGSWNVHEALEMFRLLREANLRMLAGLSEEEWERWGTHAERGRTTLASLARHMVEHDAKHLAQIGRTLGAASAGNVH